jgi:hypothetical protein
MNDAELDNWLLEHNARLVEQIRTSVDLDARYEEVLGAAAVRAIPAKRATIARSRWLATLAVAVGVVSVASILLADTSSHEPGHAVPARGPGTVNAGAAMVFRQVSGPAGLTTAAPAEWEAVATDVGGRFAVRDPGRPGRYLGYGVAVVETDDLFASHEGFEESFAANQQGYELVRLTATTFDGAEAVEWEFLYDEEDGKRRHAYGLYWLIGRHQYFIYASTPASQWDDMPSILDTVRARTHVTP